MQLKQSIKHFSLLRKEDLRIKLRAMLWPRSMVLIKLMSQRKCNNSENQFQDIVESTEEFKLIMFSV